MAGTRRGALSWRSWLMIAILGLWLAPTPGGAAEETPTIPTNEQGEPLFVTSCDGGEVRDIPDGAIDPEPGPIYPPELSARIAEAIELTTVELRTVEDLATVDVPPDTPWLEDLREQLAAGEGPIRMLDVSKDPWPDLRREMAEVVDRYYDWCVRELPNGDVEHQLLVRTWPLPWLT